MDLTAAGNGYIRTAGIQTLKITKVARREATGGSKWYDYTLQNQAEEESKVSISASEKALFVLASFAKACGITEEKALKKFQPEDCVGKKIQIAIVPEVSKGKTYHQGVALHWWPVGVEVPQGAYEDALAESKSRGSGSATTSSAPMAFASDPNDDLPFEGTGTNGMKEW